MRKAEVLSLIDFYEERSWNWSNALEFIVRKANGSLPWDEKRPIRYRRGERRKGDSDE